MKQSSFEDLVVWQKSMDLVEDIYGLIRELPNDEKYALIDQMRRSVISIPSNIAEGQQRDSSKEFVYFLSIAKGSAGELLTQLLICQRLGYLTKESIQPVIEKISQIRKMTDALAVKIAEKE